MDKIRINNLEELNDLAKEYCTQLNPGAVVCLTGDLGAGKTTFVKYISEALGIKDQVQSPTFNIQLQYKSDNATLNHFDLYRLEKAEELEDIGFYEAIEDKAITFIEWAEKFKDQMPEDAIWIEIKKIDENSREFLITQKA